jgi:hypothetical protein
LSQDVRDEAGAHVSGVAQLALGEWCGGVSEDLFDALLGRRLGLIAGRCLGLLDDLESKDGCVCSQGELQAVGSRRGSVLDVEDEVLGVAAQIEIGITPSVQF